MKRHKINYKNVAVQPEIISKIIKIDIDSLHCFRELDQLLRSDQGTAALVLRVANSSIYNRGKKINTLPMAISILGINIIRSLAVLALTRSIFTQSTNELIRLHVWHHSLLTAISSQYICNELGSGHQCEEAFIAGLLHDMGKILLFSHYADEYVDTVEFSLKNNCASFEAEKKILGIDHLEVGQQAVKEWKLPEHFVDYMGMNLEEPMCDQTENTVQLSLMAANSLLKGAGIGASLIESGIRKEKLMTIGLDEKLIDDLLEDDYMQELMKNELYQQCTNA